MICKCSSFLMLMSVMVFLMQRFAIWQISLCFFESGLQVYNLLKVSYWIRIMHLLVESHCKWGSNLFYVDENHIGVGFARARVLVQVDVVESEFYQTINRYIIYCKQEIYSPQILFLSLNCVSQIKVMYIIFIQTIDAFFIHYFSIKIYLFRDFLSFL